MQRRVAAAGYEEAGFAERYDAARPHPPIALLELVPPLAGGKLRRVVDIGSGTGLSTRIWAEHADEVIGVEPSAEMRRWAQGATSSPNVRYVAGSGEAIPVETGTADLVTASQSMQWMDPEPTLAETARVLRPGGVLCVYEYTRLQTPLWEPEAAYARVRRRWPACAPSARSARSRNCSRSKPTESLRRVGSTTSARRRSRAWSAETARGCWLRAQRGQPADAAGRRGH